MGNRPSNVLLLVLDALRFDRLSCYGYDEVATPFLDNLAEEGVRVEQAYSTGSWTVPAHGSLFTGLLPSYHGSHQTNKTFEQPAEATLAGVLSDAGYRTVGVSANPWIAPEFDFDRGFDHFEFHAPEPPFPDEETPPVANLEDLSSGHKVREILSWISRGSSVKRFSNGLWKRFTKSSFVKADQLNEAILQRVATSGDDDTFLFANYMDVHDPHYDNVLSVLDDDDPSSPSLQPDPNVSRLQYPLYSKRISFQEKPVAPERARQLYDRAVVRLDHQLRELFSSLRDHIDLKNTLIIGVGDHGECLGEHGYWGHSTFIHEELVRIPLLIRSPTGNIRNTITSTPPVSLLDLPGYVAEECGTEMPENDRSTGTFGERGPVFAECTAPRPDMEEEAPKDGYHTVVDGGWKLVRNLETNEATVSRVEPNPGDDAEAEMVKERLLALEHDRWNDQPFQPTDEDRAVSQETKNRLSDLGYL